MFERTRRRLTKQYSGVLMIFLGLFVIIVYYGLYLYIYGDQRARLNELADTEIGILQQWADQDPDPYRRPQSDIEKSFTVSADQSFYYLLVRNGNVNLAGEVRQEWREPLLEFISEGKFKKQGITKIKLNLGEASVAGSTGREETSRFYGTSRELLWKGEQIGTLYIGRDVTFHYHLFFRLSILLIGLTMLFFVLALWLSHQMSRKAMIPIVGAYARQREFVADASHELRTPLSVVLTSIEALQLEETIERNPFSNKVLDGMKDEVNAMAKLTADLLQLARSDSGEFALNRSPFNASAAAESAMDKLRAAAEAKGIAFRLQSPGAVTVNWDAERLKQLLVLLIDNAIKYTPDGGAVDVIVTESVEKGSRFLYVQVKDTGSGIAPEAISRIFDRFYRQDKSRTRQTGGHGLGLAIAKNIVDASQGTIHVDSIVGVGSTFTVRIPL